MISEGLYQAMAAAPSIEAVVAKDVNGQYAIYFGQAPPLAPRPYVVITIASARPAEHTLSGHSGLIYGRLQFDSYADGDQSTVQLTANAVRNYWVDYKGVLPDGTAIQFGVINADRDMPYEEGGIGYIYRRMLDISAFWTDPSTP